MIIVGLTGGIGSGKTTVAKMFKSFGVPIYIADVEAKTLMLNSKVIQRKLIALFGDAVYKNHELNKKLISKAIFNDKALLKKMNAIVHPKVQKHFKKWVSKQTSAYVIKEAAILFENGSYKHFDKIITVVAPKNIRIQRVMHRDDSNKKRVLSVINNQWSDAQKIALSQFVIHNVDKAETYNQALIIHQQLTKFPVKS